MTVSYTHLDCECPLYNISVIKQKGKAEKMSGFRMFVELRELSCSQMCIRDRIAFSGATDFLNKYKDKTTNDEIIGHFGLGFYSVFMVADEVHIDTLSYQKDAKPVDVYKRQP